MTTTYYTASSLDGFIATEDHALDWLLSRDIDPDGLGSNAAFLADVGALLMGASTYGWLVEHGGGEPWSYAVPTWVLTHRGDELAAGRPEAWAGADIRFVAADDDAALSAVHVEAVAAAAALARTGVWVVGGGELAGRVADLGLLDHVVLSYAPCTLGSGAPVLPRRLELALRETGRNRDFVVATYDVVR
ncbi:dihydrofolate reductase [Nocardioides zeae]|uniref:Dihydrofolate reductase n=1 Tax=Nocardioides zeae TaxID=1457234 RepID=A0ACC6IJM7_9ACTN|nr:dihydrofolate reductase family protein [Nocardioides zeae]MDR6173511.1 dihydrofolate reductase [Nocardioides zeae]MDR6210917.1 dihydrofolate reductase [Nocardioides zeae]